MRNVCFVIMCLFGSGMARADEPSWAVRDAVDRLLGRYTLMIPGGDWFLLYPNGEIGQYELPAKKYLREGSGWRVEVLTSRSRMFMKGKWGSWKDAGPQYTTWRIATLEVKSPITGGTEASWIEGSGNFERRKAPSESQVRMILSVSGPPKSAPPKSDPVTPAQDDRKLATDAREATSAPSAPNPEGGIFRVKKDGRLEKIQP
jgi:hypothetical protein